MVGVALEVHETAKLKKQQEELSAGDILNENQGTSESALVLKYQEVKPTVMGVLHYAFCYAGVLTGKYPIDY